VIVEYAEIAAPAFPDESSTILLIPSSFILLIKTVAPLSLNEPVGKIKSSFKNISKPSIFYQ